MLKTVIILLGAVAALVVCKPLDENDAPLTIQPSREQSPASAAGPGLRWRRDVTGRAKRESDEECERRALCELHARAAHSFFAAYELYFVNKENARLWDHRARSMAECRRRYRNCYR